MYDVCMYEYNIALDKDFFYQKRGIFLIYLEDFHCDVYFNRTANVINEKLRKMVPSFQKHNLYYFMNRDK